MVGGVLIVFVFVLVFGLVVYGSCSVFGGSLFVVG